MTRQRFRKWTQPAKSRLRPRLAALQNQALTRLSRKLSDIAHECVRHNLVRCTWRWRRTRRRRRLACLPWQRWTGTGRAVSRVGDGRVYCIANAVQYPPGERALVNQALGQREILINMQRLACVQ